MSPSAHGIRLSLKRAGAASAHVLSKRSVGNSRVIGLCYHSVHPTSSFASASPELFERHLAWLAEACDVIPLRAMLTAASDAERTRPAVAITLDDGYADNHEFALPLLRKYSMHATVFVTVGFCDGDPVVSERFRTLRGVTDEDVRPLSWTQVRELRASGLEIGSHTYAHPNLIRLPRAEVESELRASKAALEDRLGEAVDLFAYPFGKPGRQFDASTVDVARQAGYAYAAAILFRSARADDSPFAIPRFFVTRDSVTELAAKVRGDWDYLGVWQERAPRMLARVVSPQDFRF